MTLHDAHRPKSAWPARVTLLASAVILAYPPPLRASDSSAEPVQENGRSYAQEKYIPGSVGYSPTRCEGDSIKAEKKSEGSKTPAPSESDPDAAAVGQLREQYIKLVSVRAYEMSADELKAAITKAEREAEQRRKDAADAQLFKAVKQLEAVVLEHDGSEAAREAKTALEALGYTRWYKGKVYHINTFFMGPAGPLTR